MKKTLYWSLIAAVAGIKKSYFVYNSVVSISPSPGVFRRLSFFRRPKPPPWEEETGCVHHLEKSCFRALKFKWWQDLITTFQDIFITGITFTKARMFGCQAMSTWKVPSLTVLSLEIGGSDDTMCPMHYRSRAMQLNEVSCEVYNIAVTTVKL